MKAAKNGHLTMVRFMLEKGADKSIKDKCKFLIIKLRR